MRADEVNWTLIFLIIFVLADNEVLLNPALHKPAERYAQCFDDRNTLNFCGNAWQFLLH